MGTRKKRHGAGRGRQDRGRRIPPPAATGEEQRYLKRIKDARSEIVAVLADGRRVHGIVEYFDRDMVKITRPQGPHFFIRKSDIRHIHEVTEE
jgi:hypothetical protein